MEKKIKKSKKLNIKWHTLISKDEKSTTYLSSMLSIYSHTPIKIEGIRAESLAGLFLGIYFPEGESRRQQSFRHWGGKIISLRSNAAKYKQDNIIYWKGEKIIPNSEKHYKIIEKAIRAKFEQSEEARKALISIYEWEITNKEGNPEGKYKISPDIFCDILKNLCNEFVQKDKLNFFIINPTLTKSD